MNALMKTSIFADAACELCKHFSARVKKRRFLIVLTRMMN